MNWRIEAGMEENKQGYYNSALSTVVSPSSFGLGLVDCSFSFSGLSLGEGVAIPDSFEVVLSAFVAPLSSFVAPLPSFVAPPSSFGAPPSSLEALPSSFVAPLSSLEALPSSFVAPLSSLEALPSSFVAPLSSLEASLTSFVAPPSSFGASLTSLEAPLTSLEASTGVICSRANLKIESTFVSILAGIPALGETPFWNQKAGTSGSVLISAYVETPLQCPPQSQCTRRR